jgi:hypothetical protein
MCVRSTSSFGGNAMQTIIALFDTPSEAEAVVGDLELAGYQRSEISVIVGQRPHGTNPDSNATGIGAAIGAGVGLLAGLVSIAVPGIGIVLALGPILAGGVIGGVAGGLVGMLVDMGVPALEARHYQEAVRRGGTLISLAVEDADQIRAVNIIAKHHPVDIRERALAWHEAGWNGESVSLAEEMTDEVETPPMSTSPMSTMSAPTAQPTRETGLRSHD